jgi:hypothetical protein
MYENLARMAALGPSTREPAHRVWNGRLTISRRLGHGSPTITLGVYGHLFTDTDDHAAQTIEAAFAGTKTE